MLHVLQIRCMNIETFEKWPVSVKPCFLNTEVRTNHIKASAYLWGPTWALLSWGHDADRHRPTPPAASSYRRQGPRHDQAGLPTPSTRLHACLETFYRSGEQCEGAAGRARAAAIQAASPVCNRIACLSAYVVAGSQTRPYLFRHKPEKTSGSR